MSEVLQANIFFFITSVAVIIFTLLVCVLLYQVIKIIRSIRRIVERIEEGSEVIADDVTQLRSFVVEGSLVSQIISFFLGQRTHRRTRRAAQDKDEE